MIFIWICHGPCVSSNALFDFVFWNLVKLDIVSFDIVKKKLKNLLVKLEWLYNHFSHNRGRVGENILTYIYIVAVLVIAPRLIIKLLQVISLSFYLIFLL
jgi:hypothetical protein